MNTIDEISRESSETAATLHMCGIVCRILSTSDDPLLSAELQPIFEGLQHVLNTCGERVTRINALATGELLFEFYVERTHTSWRCELRDHGAYGVEAQFLDPVDVVIARTFRQDMDPTRTPREMAITWATEEPEGHRERRRVMYKKNLLDPTAPARCSDFITLEVVNDILGGLKGGAR